MVSSMGYDEDITTMAEYVDIDFFDEDFDGCTTIDEIYNKAENDPYYSKFKRSEILSIVKRSDKFKHLASNLNKNHKIYTRFQIQQIMTNLQKTLHPTDKDLDVYKFLINFKGSALSASERMGCSIGKILEFKRKLENVISRIDINLEEPVRLKMEYLIEILNGLHEKNIAELMDALYENGVYYERRILTWRFRRIGLLGIVISEDRFQDVVKPVDKQILVEIDRSRRFKNIEEVTKYYNSHAQTKVGQYTLLYWMFKLGFYGLFNRYKKCDL